MTSVFEPGTRSRRPGASSGEAGALDTRPSGIPAVHGRRTGRSADDTNPAGIGVSGAADTNPAGLSRDAVRASAERRSPDAPGSGATAAFEAQATVPRHDLPVLEAYRGIAALMVLVTHVGFTAGPGVVGPWAGWLSRLDFGVALFFLLSGFLLFRPFVQGAYALRPPVKVGSYLRRRYVRIYPAFLVVVAGVYVLSPRARAQDDSLWIQTILMVQNYFTAFGEQLNGLVQTWSLVIEVSFYLTLPLLAWLVLGRGTAMAAAVAAASTGGAPADATGVPADATGATSRTRRGLRAVGRGLGLPALRRLVSLPPRLAQHRPAVVLVALFAGSVAWRAVFMIRSDGYAEEMLWLPAFIDWFVAGMTLAWLRERPAPIPLWLRHLANAPGVCVCLALTGYWLTTTRLGGPYDLTGGTTAQGVLKHVLFSAIATLILLPAVFGSPRARWRRHAVNPLMRWLGQVSFGVFLWHPILMELIRDALDYELWQGGFWVTLILTLIASLAVGTLSWRFIEEPTQRRFRNGFRTPAVRAPRQPLALPGLPRLRRRGGRGRLRRRGSRRGRPSPRARRRSP